MFRLGLSVVVLCAWVEGAFAQGAYSLEHRDWEVSAFGGGSFVEKFELPTSVSGNGQQSSRTVGMRYASGYEVGLRVNQNLGDFGAATLEYSFANQPLTFTNLSPSIPTLSLGQAVHHLTYAVSYLPMSRLRRFRPYGGAGAGAALFYIHKDSKSEAAELGLALRDSWKFVVSFGGGFKYLVGDQVALTLDVKDHLSGIPTYGLPKSAQIVNGQFQPGLFNSGIMHNVQINFGVAFQWDEWSP